MKLFKFNILVLILMIIPEMTYSRSISMPRPDPWYIHEVSIEPTSIPEGITFNPDSQTLINNTDIPLYIVRELERIQEWVGVLPNTVLPSFKIVSNTSYRFHYEHNGWGDEMAKRQIGQKRIGSIDVFRALTSHDRRSLTETYGPGRPHDVKPPETKTLMFAGFYGAQKIVFEGSLSYKINEKYNKNLWFKFDKLEINPNQLPSGVKVVSLPKQFNRNNRLFEIFNDSNTPFYIVKNFDAPIEWLEILPNDVFPDYKLVSGKQYYSRHIQSENLKEAWQLLLNAPMLEITPLIITKLSKPNFMLKNIKEDCRPEDINIPVPQPFEIVTYYGTNKHILSGNIVYKINPYYRPLAGSPKTSSCDGIEKASSDIDWTPIPSGRECEERLAGYGKRAKAICYDFINPGWRGPLMVVVPTGDGFSSNFAIGKYETSVGDYAKYCTISKSCIPVENMEKLNNPITGISLDEARAYTAWLSERTGKTYRLPTAAEWEYAANAAGKQPKNDSNCRVIDDDKVIKGNGIVSIKSRQSNGWGLKNYIGNVQEWVVTDSGEVMAVGGNFNTPIEECSLDYMKAHNGSADGYTGFRVLMEME